MIIRLFSITGIYNPKGGIMKRFFVAIPMLLLLVTSAALGGEEGEGKEPKQPVFIVDNSNFPPSESILIEGDWTRLTRLSDRVKIETALSDLNPYWVYNAHIWIFNNPAECLGSPAATVLGGACSVIPDQFWVATEPSVVSFGGFIPDSSGNLDLELDLKISEGLPAVSLFETNGSFTNVVIPAGGVSVGLIDPMDAEIQFILARKGLIQRDMTLEQFQTVFGSLWSRFHAATV